MYDQGEKESEHHENTKYTVVAHECMGEKVERSNSGKQSLIDGTICIGTSYNGQLNQ